MLEYAIGRVLCIGLRMLPTHQAKQLEAQRANGGIIVQYQNHSVIVTCLGQGVMQSSLLPCLQVHDVVVGSRHIEG